MSNANNVKVSVIIPVYNAEKYLNDCLESIINQTLDNIEIICVNDGSFDNSIDILNKYANLDNRVKVISTENNGQGSARNIALNYATGEFISFVDADDWIESNSYEILYNHAQKYNLDILFFQMINYINSSDKFVETDLYNHKCFINNFKSNQVFSFNDFKNFLFEIPVCPVSKLYRRDFLLNNNLTFPVNIIFEDNLFFYTAIFFTEKMGFLDEHLYYRRRHDESVTQNITKKAYDIVIVTNEILNIFQKYGMYNELKMNIINHVFSMIMEWFFKSPLEYCEEFFLKIKDNSIIFTVFREDFQKYLNKEYSNIYQLFLKNNHYIDFILEYKLFLVEYSNIIDSKTKDYKVSVIIPIFNNEKIIHRTLMSVLNQSLGRNNIEIILINDNSTDNTSKVINEYAFKFDNIKAIHLKNNTGSSGIPRNIGIMESSADYIMFLDHDDFFTIDAIEKLYSEALDKNCDIVFGTYAVVSKGKFTQISYPNEKHGYIDNIKYNERFVSFPPPSIWTKLFKKDFIKENNILFPPFLGEDAIFMSKSFLKAEGINYLSDTLICFHALDEKSATNNVSLNYLIEGLISEKYLLGLFKDIDKEYYFKFRCEGNIDFFLTQFLRSKLSMEEFHRLLPLLSEFMEVSNQYSLSPNKSDNKPLFEYVLSNNVNSIIEFKKEFGIPIKSNVIKKGNFKDNIKNNFKKILSKFSINK